MPRTPPAQPRPAEDRLEGQGPQAGRPSGEGRLSRPAFYALRPGGWRDLVTLLHPPYTAWNLSYVALGAAAAPTVYAGRLAAALAAFLLAVGVSAHALDELRGRPLRTGLSSPLLVTLAVTSLIGAVAIGIAGAVIVSPLLVPLVIVGGLPRARLQPGAGRRPLSHRRLVRPRMGGLPRVHRLLRQRAHRPPGGVLVAAACFLLSSAQRRLSTPVRRLRRSTVEVSGTQTLSDGRVIELTRESLSAPLEGALSALWLALVLLAIGLVVVRA